MIRIFPGVFFLALAFAAPPAQAQEAQAVVDAAIRYYRGKASVCLMDMKITRPNWQRDMTIKAWTKGQKKSIFYITAPPKDEGNGTLKLGGEMWTYNPKVNRVMKLPPSMMSQGWMGSDFSNDDLAKSDSVVVDYTHEMEGYETHEGKKVFVIRSTPKQGAAVVWGQQRLKIREDHILLLEEFFDEEKKPVKAMASSQIQTMGGKLFPRVWTMRRADAPGEFTTVTYRQIRFDMDLSDNLFTEASLRTAWR